MKPKFKSLLSLLLSCMMCLSAVDKNLLQVLAEETVDDEAVEEIAEDQTETTITDETETETETGDEELAETAEEEPEFQEIEKSEVIPEIEESEPESETEETADIQSDEKDSSVLNSSSDFTFTVNASGTATITGLTATQTADFQIVFPETVTDENGSEYTVTAIESSGNTKFSSQKLLTKITIPKTVKTLGTSTFSSCSKLETVTFEEGIQLSEIPQSLFGNCTLLKEISIPEGVTKISGGAFYNCNGLNTITLPSTVEAAASNNSGYYPFYGAGNTQTEVNFTEAAGKKWETIPASLFRNSKIGSVTIPASVTSIGSYVFGNAALQSIDFEDGSELSEIGDHAFYSCTSLKGVKLPAGVESIGANAFASCEAFTAIVTSAKAAGMTDKEKASALILSDSLTSIGNSAFSSCKELTEVTIPKTVKTLGTSAFSSCSKLETVTFEEGIQLSEIPQNIFYNCAVLKEISIPEGVTKISGGAFYNCNGLNTITLPSTVEAAASNNSGYYPFYGAGNTQTEVNFTEAAGKKWETIPASLFRNSKIGSITIPASVTSIGDYAFNTCSNLTEAVIESKALTIGSRAFGLTNSNGNNANLTIYGWIGSNSENYSISNTIKSFIPIGVLASEINVSPSELTAYAGIPDSLTAELKYLEVDHEKYPVLAEGFEYEKAVWSTSDHAIVTVDQEGILSPLKAGVATVTASIAGPAGTELPTSGSVFVTVVNPVVDITDTSAEIWVDEESHKTNYTIDPTSKKEYLRWESSNDAYATVDADGVVTAVDVPPRTNHCTVIITAHYGIASDSYPVTVYKWIDPESVTLNKTTLDLITNVEEKKTAKLSASVLPTYTTDPTVFWESSDSRIVKVDQEGNVTAVSNGTAVITAYAKKKDGSKVTAECEVTVTTNVTGIELSESEIELYIGDEYKLTAALLPENASDRTVTWTSDRPEIAAVDANGKISALAKGTAVITATTGNGFTAECKVTVNNPKPTAISLDAETAALAIGETIQLNALLTPDNAEAELTWTSSNDEVATVTGEGLVTAVSAGTAVITVKTDNGLTAECTVTVLDDHVIRNIEFKHSCSFGNNLSINYYAPVKELTGYENIRMEVRKQIFNDDGSISWETTELKKYTSSTQSGVKYYRFVYPGIAPKEMGAEVRMVLKCEKDGETYVTLEDVYGIGTYAYNRLNASTNADFKTLIVDMLNYGAEAQKYFNYNTANLVNADLTAEQKALGTQQVPELKSVENDIETAGATATFYGKSAVFNANVELKYYMQFAEGQSLDNVKLVLTYTAIDDKEYTEEINASNFGYDKSKKAYTAKLITIAAKDVGCTVTAKIYDGSKLISNTLEYSLETYAYNRLIKSTDEVFKAFLRAFMKYGFSAEKYFRTHQ